MKIRTLECEKMPDRKRLVPTDAEIRPRKSSCDETKPRRKKVQTPHAQRASGEDIYIL